MPSSSVHDATTRQWDLLQKIPSRSPGLTTTELLDGMQEAGYQVSKRTIERDLVALSRLFPLQCNDKGTPYGWYWAEGASVSLPGISTGEALCLVLVEDAIRPLLPGSMLRALEPRFRFARKKLESLSQDNQTIRWLGKVASVSPDLSLLPPNTPENILETLQAALLQEKQLQCRYYSAHNDKERELVLNPLALVQRGPITYLIGTAPPYADVRQYAIHRFRQAETLPSSALGLDDFDLQEYLASNALQFGSTAKISLQARLSDSLARLLRETPLSSDMTLEKLQEGYRLRATISDTWQLQWWILSQGDALIIEAPLSLRQQIAEKLKQASAQYDCVHEASLETST